MLVERFAEEDLADAAALLVDRLERERDGGMPWRESFLERDAALSYLKGTFNGNDGRLVRNEGSVTAYMQATERRQPPWLPSSWLHLLDHAAASPEAYRYLYADAAGDWVSTGCLDHYAVVPVLDDVVEVFFELGFGLEQIFAIRSLDDVETQDHPSAVIRRATPADLPRLGPLLDAIAVYQEGAPVFGLNTITTAELEEGHGEILEDPNAHYWLAEKGNRVVGFAIFEPTDVDGDPFLPETTIALEVAAVAREERAAGIGSALTSAGLREAAATGFTHCITDWRSANLTSGPMWTRWGFRPYAYRLHRTVDPRLAPR